MSDLLSILDRLVQENLHGPIDPSTLSPSSGRHPQQPQQPTEDMDAHDPRNDDLLFFVQKADEAVENGGLGVDPVFVKRKIKPTKRQGHQQQTHHHHLHQQQYQQQFIEEQEQRLLTPAQEAVVLWKDTFFLNVIVQLQCKLTVAVCSRVAETDPETGMVKTSMTCTRKHVSKRVYASPTKSRMDVKEESVECSWPLIYYVVDDFEDMFEQLMVRDNEYLCVELAVTLPSATTSSTSISSTAEAGEDNGSGVPKISTSGLSRHADAVSSPDGLRAGKPFPSASFSAPGTLGSGKISNKITLFQGAAGFQSLLGIYQQKAAPKIGKRLFKNLLSLLSVPTEFVMMRGPGGRGHAQVAITASNIGDDPALAYVEDLPSPRTASQYTNGNGNGKGNGYSPSSAEKNLPPIPGGAANGDQIHHTITGSAAPQTTSSPSLSAQSTKAKLEIVSHASPSSSNAQQQTPASSPKPFSSISSTAKSISAGSFFQSLRRISLSTLAQAGVFGTTAASESNSSNGGASTTSSAIINAASSPTTTTTAHHPIHVHVNPSSHSLGGPATANSPPTSPVSTPKKHHTSNTNQPPSSVSSTAGSTTESISAGTRQEIEALVKQPQSLRCCMTFVNVPWTGVVTLLMNHAYSLQQIQVAKLASEAALQSPK
ncbi:hypothetical protein BGZ83_008222 [Gryganskiella cystojenkinii]|nr:hypothetical protein BGZ83_008222 [Gryganskiella cystojenkinii]